MHNVYYFTDIHGQYALFSAIRNWCKQQDPECMIIFGGDAADRGECGYAIMKELINDPNIVYLYGNHEDLFVNAAKHYARNKKYTMQEIGNIMAMTSNEDMLIYKVNEGYSTFRDWALDGANSDFIERIRCLPRTFSYENIDFCHAGSTYFYFNEVSNCEYYNKQIPSYIESPIPRPSPSTSDLGFAPTTTTPLWSSNISSPIRPVLVCSDNMQKVSFALQKRLF